MININTLIASAMKQGDRERLNTLKLMKAEFVKAEKNGITVDDAQQVKILLKMVAQRNDSIISYTKGGRNDLADIEQREIDIIKEFIPEQPTDDDIAEYTKECIKRLIEMNDSDYRISMRDTKAVVAMVQEKYASANGKIISKTLKEFIEN